LNSRKCSWQP